MSVQRIQGRREGMAAALRSARRVLVRERSEQFASFSLPPHRRTPEAYAAMSPGERRAIRSFDRVIAKIDEALGDQIYAPPVGARVVRIRVIGGGGGGASKRAKQ